MIPTDRPLRQIHPFATTLLTDLHQQAFFGEIDQPSVDPELLIRMLLTGDYPALPRGAGRVSTDAQRQKCAVAEYLAGLEAEAQIWQGSRWPRMAVLPTPTVSPSPRPGRSPLVSCCATCFPFIARREAHGRCWQIESEASRASIDTLAPSDSPGVACCSGFRSHCPAVWADLSRMGHVSRMGGE
jgi:hypothetical protein